jgi:hypothetical protein
VPVGEALAKEYGSKPARSCRSTEWLPIVKDKDDRRDDGDDPRDLAR